MIYLISIKRYNFLLLALSNKKYRATKKDIINYLNNVEVRPIRKIIEIQLKK